MSFTYTLVFNTNLLFRKNKKNKNAWREDWLPTLILKLATLTIFTIHTLSICRQLRTIYLWYATNQQNKKIIIIIIIILLKRRSQKKIIKKRKKKQIKNSALTGAQHSFSHRPAFSRTTAKPPYGPLTKWKRRKRNGFAPAIAIDSSCFLLQVFLLECYFFSLIS